MEKFNYGNDYYAYLTHKVIELDLDCKCTNEGVPAMNAIELVAILEGAQIRLACIQYVYSILDRLKL